MVNCSFCNKEIPKGRGSMFVENTGKVRYFCSRKCESYFLRQGRDPRGYKWSSKKTSKKG